MLPILTEADTQHEYVRSQRCGSELQSGSRHAARLPAAEFAAFEQLVPTPRIQKNEDLADIAS